MKYSGIEWVGNIPSNWRTDILSVLFYEHKLKNKGMAEQNLLSLSYGNIIRKDITQSGGLLPESFETYNIVDKDDIIFRLTDLQNDKRSLRTGLCKERGIITSAYIAIRKRTNIHTPYFHYLFHTYDLCKVFYGLGDGVRQGMNYADMRKLPLIIPSDAQQKAIADFLDKKCGEIDELVALQEKIIEELKSYKQSVITETVCKGLNPNAPMKDSGVDWIGEIPEGWSVMRLKNILSSPLQYGANESGGAYNPNLPRYVRITDILDNKLRENIDKQSLTEEQASGYILKHNDILFARSGGTVGKSFIFREEYGRCAFAGYLIRAQLKQDFKADFVFYYTQSHSYDEWKKQIFIQATIQNIGADRYSELLIPIPCISEQQEIADYLDKKCSEIDQLISIKQQKIVELKEYKKSLIYEYTTGKKEV